MTAIEWTDATWNPVTGCSKVSPGCAHCYAETLSHRWKWTTKPWTPDNAAENVVLHPERLSKPLSWRKPRMVFVNSMSDLFHEQVPDEFIAKCFSVMAQAQRHTFQILTKRPERTRHWFREIDGMAHVATSDGVWAEAPHIWLGTSIENDRHTFRADILRETPAAVRFISAEPLLGPLPSLDLTGIDWLIVGGESGPHARPMSEEWVRKLRDACISWPSTGDALAHFNHGTPIWRPAFFFKQWGGRTPKSGGRLLDGREWNEYPQTMTVAA